MTIPPPDQLAANSVFLRRVAERLLASPDLADDAVQEAMLVSLRRPGPPTAGMRAWLTGVLKNVARNLRRGEARRAHHERLGSPRETTSAEAIRAREATRRRLIEAVLTLPDPLREVILLRYDEGLPPREVAERTGAPVSTVHDRLQRAVIALRERLELEPGDTTPEGARGAERRRLALAAFAGSLPNAASGALVVGGVVMGKKIALGAAALLLVAATVTYALLPRAERSAPPRSSEIALSAASTESTAREGPKLEGAGRTPLPPDRVPKGESVLFGRVVAAGAGTPVTGARVQAFSFEGLRLLAEQTTDGSGGFAFPETKDRTGAFHLVVRHPDFAPHVERWARAQAEPLSIALAAPSWIIGRLVFAEGESAPAPGSLRAFDRQPLSDGSTDVLGLDLAQMLPGELRVAAEFGGAGEGAFRLGPLRAGLYSVAYVSEGRPPLEVGSAKSYEPATGISVPRGETVDLGTVLLPATRRLVVRVVDAESHAPVLDATFAGVHEMDRARTAVPLLATPTGVPGEYALSSWPDPLTMDLGPVRVTAPGYGSAGANYPVNHYEGPPVARLARTGRLEGEVRNDAGEPLPGLVVLARLVVDGGLLGATTTDSGGRFALEALPALQEVDVVAVDRSARSLLAVAPVTLEPGRTLRVVLGGTDVTGVGGVITNAETPVAGAVISLDEPDGRRIQVQTAVDGRFAFVGLRTGRHELAAWIPVSDTFVKRVVDVEGGRVTDASVTLRNRLAGRLDVRTLDGERAELGTKASDVRVLAQPIEPKHTPSVEVPVQSDGTFALLLPNAALWRLSLEGKGAVVLEPPTVEMPRPADAPPVTLPVTLDPGDGTFALMVKDAESGALLPDATFHGEHGTWTSAGTIGDDATVREEDARIGHYEYAIGEDEHVTVLVGFDLTPTVRSVVRDVRLPRANGVRVTGFSGPANARAAGLEVGDVILRHGDARVENLRALRTAIDATKPADSVRVEIQRAGASVFLSLAGGRLGITAENVRVEAH